MESDSDSSDIEYYSESDYSDSDSDYNEFVKNCKNNNLEGVSDCLSLGVDVNTTSGGWTGLMFACDYGNSAIVTRLVQFPAVDINFQNEFGDTAMHMAS